jgi:hypothetical protein
MKGDSEASQICEPWREGPAAPTHAFGFAMFVVLAEFLIGTSVFIGSGLLLESLRETGIQNFGAKEIGILLLAFGGVMFALNRLGPLGQDVYVLFGQTATTSLAGDWYRSGRRMVIRRLVIWLWVSLWCIAAFGIVYLFSDSYHTATLAALSQALVWNGFITQFNADKWNVTQSRVKPSSVTHRVKGSTSASKAKRTLEVVHFSDLHLTAGRPLVQGNGRTDPAYAALIREHSSLLAEVPAIILTGDITDAGRPGEWRSFFELTPEQLLNKMVIAPGNHDVSVSGSTAVIEDPDAISRSVRLVRMISAIVRVQGGRSSIVGPDGEVCSLTEFLEPYIPRINQFMLGEKRTRRFRPRNEVEFAHDAIEGLRSPKAEDLVHSIWRLIFPMAVQCADGRAVVFVMDTNNFNMTVLDNAIGTVDKGDIPNVFQKLTRLRAAFQRVPALYAIHHHLFWPDDSLEYRPVVRPFLTLTDAEETYEAVRAGGSTVVFHGHHHVHYIARLDGMVDVVGGPSTTLGDSASKDRAPGFFKYTIATRRSSRSAVELVDDEFFSASGTPL